MDINTGALHLPAGPRTQHSKATVAEFMGSCEKLGHFVERYRAAADGPYRGNPEALSAMHLTMMELWTVLDSSAINLVPLLQEYAPGFPLNLFDGLALPKREQLERLARVEDYLDRRRAAAGSNGPPWRLLLGHGSWSKTCFAVRYYNSSPPHQQLHKDIIRQAEDAHAANKQRATDAAGVARLARQSYEETAAEAAEASKAVDAAKAERAARAAEAVKAAEAARAAKVAKRTEASAAVTAAAATRVAARAAAAAGGAAEAAGVAVGVAEGALRGAQKAVGVAEGALRDAQKAVGRAEAEVDVMWETFFVWPLPEDETAAKAVVFELRPPAVFAVWRETTLSILAGFCDTNPDGSRLVLWYPSDHPAVASNLKGPDQGRACRFRLAFKVDKFSHDQGMGHPYEYSGSRLSEPFCVKDISHGCGLYDTRPRGVRLCYPPDTVSPTLQRWILGTAHTPNDVFATQSRCPEDMTLDEFRTFGCLRAGLQLQWQNILLQLAMPSLDLNRPEAFFLFMQAANEAGPRGEGPGAPRRAHAILGEERFGVALLAALEDALCRVARKWESEVSLCIFVSLAVKLLSFSPHQSVQHRCLDYLRRLRHETANRARHLGAQLRGCGTADQERRARLAQHSSMIALICHATFDVGATHAPSVFSDSAESALLIEASIRAAECAPSRLPGHPTAPILDLLLHRWRRVSYEAEPRLKDLVVDRESPCLDMAVRAVWPSYKRGGKWSPAPVPHCHVLITRLPASSGRDPLSLQYNLLTGDFMVGGSPFSPLPADFQEHGTYGRMFGSATFTVVPSYMRSQGMQYMATSTYHGHELHFAMLNRGRRLVVRSEKGGTVYELIPVGSLRGDFPDRLLDGYAHWLVLGGGKIEFRPIGMAWQTLEDVGHSSDGYYVLDLGDPAAVAAAARMTKANSSIETVDVHSETAYVVHSIFWPLESPRFIEMGFDHGRSVLNISLERLRLSFTLASGGTTIASDQYRGYCIDEDQSIGALSGLKSKLVLRRSYGGRLDARLVLIPAGDIFFAAGPDGRAWSTSIETPTGDRVQHHVFRIDTMLGCLRDGGAVSSKLLLCHLHAITTHCLPDRLTGRTGTEEALRILSLAAVQPAGQLQLQSEDVDRLRQIARISPSWWGGNSVVATVTWPYTAPRVAQDGAFRELAEAILGESGLPPDSSFLVRRAAARMSAYRAPLYGAGQPQPAAERPDVRYPGYVDWKSEFEVCRLARHIINDEGHAMLLHPAPPQDVFFNQYPVSRLPSWGKSVLKAEFNTRWLNEPGDISIDTWCNTLQEIDSLRRGNPPGNHRYKLILFFAGLLFAPKANLAVIQLLLAVATAPIVQSIEAAGDEPLDPPVVVDLVEALANAATHVDDQVRLGDMKACFAALVEQISKLPLSSRQYPEEPTAQAHMSSEEPAGSRGFLSVDDMFGRSTPPARRSPRGSLMYRHPVLKISNEQPQPKLLHLLSVLQGMARFEHERRYVKELKQGVGALQDSGARRLWDPDRRRRPLGHIDTHQREADDMLATVSGVLDAATTTTTTTTQGGPGGEPAQPPPSPGPSGVLPDAGSTRHRLLEHQEACHREVADGFAAIRDALSGTTDSTLAPATGRSNGTPGDAQRDKPLPLALRLPAVTPMLLLERLSRRHRAKLSDEWLRCLVDYAISLTALQRAERMVRAADDDKALARELQNVGHKGWDPNAFPDWLLLEVEMDILIRPVQALIASSMMRPPGARSHVMQLNMGEGKSSVVVPMVASALADGSRLVRIIVAKPQSWQMLHTLIRALGGLLDRRVYQLPPFSRGSGHNTESGASSIASLCADCVACLRSGGVLLAQPEHILSLRLSGLEAALLATDRTRADKQALFALQRFLDTHSRDIIDESDEILSTKSELIYTMGSQDAIDLGPLRWRMIQSILGLVAEIAPAIGKQYPDMVEVGGLGPEGRFPRIRILNEAGAAVLTDRLVQRIFDGGLAGFSHVAVRQRHVKDAMLRYVMQPEPGADDIAVIEAAEELQQPLFLLRGLIAYRVLYFALQKRWRVNYGRTDDRDPPTGLAVPFRAKDLPVPQAEFSHPDVVIILTCLSYYYGGLRDDELFRLIERLSLSADGEREYLAWVQSAPNGIPPALSGLGDINTNDREHCIAEVFPRLRHFRMAVNYYLSNILFSREMREYPQKLSESGWSIAATRAHPATGFSGTNDTKYLLPLGIKSLDLKEQRHTNALVLNHLLRPENTVQDVQAGELPAALPGHGPPLTLQLLRHVVDSKLLIRVVIDAGAQIVELDNAETARQWLDLVPAAEASAAVFFNSDEEMCVVSRDGTIQPFLTSPYATNTESCLVYIDDAHTRGTDLRLPSDYRAAVTLGPALTRDRIVQACMRMRELGHGQSVVFLMPVEIRRKITKLRGMPLDGNIEVADVLAWSISETWREVSQLTPLWAVQGRRHQRRQLLWRQVGNNEHYELSGEMAKQFLERESLTLRERYHSSHHNRPPKKILTRTIAARTVAARVIAGAVPDGWKSEAARIQERCQALGVSKQRHELSLEKEEERELLAEALKAGVQKTLPPGVVATKPSLHKDVETFVATGTIPDGSPAFLPAFRALAGSSVAGFLEGLPGGSGCPPDRRLRLFATADFARTIRLSQHTDAAGDILDLYQRPVQWVVTTAPDEDDGSSMAIAVLSPWEANALMPTFRSGTTATTLHLFAPRTSLTTRSAEDLLLYTTPATPAGWRAPPQALILALLLFAGQLYLRTYDDYVETCRLLGVPCGAEGDDDDGQVGSGKETAVFGPDAVPFFLGLFGKIRHPSADLSCTDIGHILAGDVLRPSYFSGPMRTR